MDDKACPPDQAYYCFEFAGRRILYDIYTKGILEISDPRIYDLLDGALRGSMDEARASVAAKYPGAPEAFADETFEQFHQAGLLLGPEDGDAEAEGVENLEALLDHRPNRIQLALTGGKELNRAAGRMSPAVARQAVEHLVRGLGDRRYFTIAFLGDAPLKHFETIRETVCFADVLAKSRGLKVDYSWTTSGASLVPEIREYIVSRDIDVTISLDMSDGQAVANAQALDQQLRDAGRAGVQIRFSDDGTLEALGQAGFSRVTPSAITEPIQARVVRWLDALEADPEWKDPMMEGMVRRWVNRLSKPLLFASVQCGIGRNCATVDGEGRIFPCHRYVGVPSCPSGHVLTGQDREALAVLYRTVIRMRLERCSGCWARFYCGGPCPWSLSQAEGAGEGCDAEWRRTSLGDLRFLMYVYARLANVAPDFLREAMSYRTRLMQDLEQLPAK